MTAARRATGTTTRRAVCRILGSADSLPERSKASKVLTIVACRLQLFVFELERARCEHFGLGIEQLLERCNEHCQLLGVASRQGGGVQSGYALLSELSLLLQELEASVLLLPGQLGSEARYKPALDELQALLANVSHYRTECEDTRRHLEAALGELVEGYAARATSPGAAAAAASLVSGDTATQVPTPSPQHDLLSERSGITTSSAQGGECDVGVSDDSGFEIAVLHRVRQVICGLDLDVDMADRDAPELDEELLQLRDQMHQALQDLDPLPSGAQQGASVRLGARRPREDSAAGAADTAPSSASASWASLSPASSMSAGGGASLLDAGSTGAGSGVSRLHAARRVSRRLAAQHLARLKEQQRQLRLAAAAAAASGAAGGGDVDAQPATRRRRVEIGSEDRGGGALGTASIAFGRELRSPAGLAASALPGQDTELAGRATGAGGAASREPGVASLYSSALGSGSTAGGSDNATVVAGAYSSGAPRLSAPAGASQELNSQPEPEPSLTAAAADAAPGLLQTGQAGLAAARQRAGVVAAAATGADADAAAGVSQPGSPSRRSTEDSVAALRKLNRVTQLAGMWEAGRPVAQQGAADDDGGVGTGSGSLSDCEELGSGRSDGDGGSDAGGELPAGPAPRRPAAAAPPACVAPPLPRLPALPGLPGPAGGVASSSPFYMLALHGKAPKAPPVLGRLLAPPPEAEPLLEETPASPAARARAGGGNSSPLGSPTAAAAGAFGGQRLRGAAAGGLAAPAPLPLPDASVHLRAVGLPGCFAPHWVPPGPFGLPAHAAAAGAAGGLWLMGGVGAMPATGDGEASGGGNGGGGEQLLNLGPDVPTLDLHRDITGWGPCLGRGAFGAVYKAIFRNKPAAVKVLHGGALDVRDVRSLRTEISLLCRLRHHPNIITVYGAAAAPPDHVALVTELMDCDLYDYIHRRRQNCVPLDEVLSIARAIASGLSELHPTIVHRDLKPANVLLKHSAPHQQPQQQPQGTAAAAGPSALDRRLTVKIADFGLARHKRSQYLSTRERDAGTLKYMAPECISTGGGSGGGDGNGNDGGEGTGGSGITEKCDIYSFGVLLYELITGREPWEGCHPLYAMCQVQSGVTLQLPDDPARCPPSLRALVLRCWAYQHHQRPSSREVLAELDHLIAARQQEVAEEGGGGGVLAEAHAAPLWQ